MGRTFPLQDAINAFAGITDRYLPRFPDDAFKMLAENRAMLLDAVDFVLGRISATSNTARNTRNLSSHSAKIEAPTPWERNGSGRLELQHRQPEAVTALIAQVTSNSDRASEHLRQAWSKAFGMKPDPNGACIEAAAAIEIAAEPIISPNSAKVTLGTLGRAYQMAI